MAVPNPTSALSERFPTFSHLEPGIGSSFDLAQREPMGVGRGYPLDNNPFAAILGPPNNVQYTQTAMDLQPRPFVAFTHSYAGTNPQIERYITFAIVGTEGTFETSNDCIPWEQTENIGKFVTMIQTFDPMVAPIITELAPARHLESRTEMKATSLEMRGLGFMMSEAHFTTAEGQQDLRNNLIALAKSIVLTVKELTIQALINANTAEQNAQIYYGTEDLNRDEKLFEEIVNSYAASVRPGGYRYFVNNIKRRTGNFYNVNGLNPTSLLVPQRVSYILEWGHKEQTEYKTAGPPENRVNQFKLSSLNLQVALITSTMISGTVSEPMVRYSAPGEFFTVGGTPSYRANKFRSSQRDVFVYNTSKDIMDRVKYFESLEKTEIWKPDGGYTNKFESWFNKMTSEWELGAASGKGEARSSNTINPAPFISSKDKQKRLKLASLFGHLSEKITERDFRYSAETILAQVTRGMSEEQFMNDWNECEKILSDMNLAPANEEFFEALVSQQDQEGNVPTTKTPNGEKRECRSREYHKGTIPLRYVEITEFKQNQYGGLDLPQFRPEFNTRTYPPGYNNYGGLMTLASGKKNGWGNGAENARKVLDFVARLAEALQNLLPSSMLLDPAFCPPWNHKPSVHAAIVDALVGFQPPLFLGTAYTADNLTKDKLNTTAYVDKNPEEAVNLTNGDVTYTSNGLSVTIPALLRKYSAGLGEIHFYARMTQKAVNQLQHITAGIDDAYSSSPKEAETEKKYLFALLEEAMERRPERYYDNYIGLAMLYYDDYGKGCFKKLMSEAEKANKEKLLKDWTSLTPINYTPEEVVFNTTDLQPKLAPLLKAITEHHKKAASGIKSKTGLHLNLDPESKEHKELLKTHGKVEGVQELSAKCGEMMKILHEEEKKKTEGKIGALGSKPLKKKSADPIDKGLFLRTPLNYTDGIRTSINVVSRARPGSKISQYTAPDLLLTDLPDTTGPYSFLNTHLGRFIQIATSFGKNPEPTPATTFSHTSKLNPKGRKFGNQPEFVESAFFSEIFRESLEKRFVGLKREGSKLLRLFMMCFLTTRCDNWRVLKTLYENDIYFPISTLVMAPFIVSQMACAILMKGGRDTGSNYYGKQSLLFTQDNRVGGLHCRYALRLGTVIRKRKHICVIPDVAPVGYVGGGNTKWITSREDYKVKFRELTEYHPSLVSTICPPSFAAEQHKYIHTAGFDSKKSLEDQPNGWECSGFICDRFGLEAYFGNHVPAVHTYHTEGHVRAEILCRTTTLNYDPKQGRFSMLDLGTGHRQELRYPGARAVWQGETVGKDFDFSRLVVGVE